MFLLFFFFLDNCIKMLFVADPQIIGETYDKHFYNDLAIIDSDRFVLYYLCFYNKKKYIICFQNLRYLRHGYKKAFQHVQPDLIIFLGDLMDEGSVATDIEFQRYYDRFKRIFNQDTNVMTNKFLRL